MNLLDLQAEDLGSAERENCGSIDLMTENSIETHQSPGGSIPICYWPAKRFGGSVIFFDRRNLEVFQSGVRIQESESEYVKAVDNEPSNKRFYVNKLYGVGRPYLQKLLGVVAADPSFLAGVLVTTSTFPMDARQFAEQNARLKLVDKNILARLLVQNRVPVKLG